MFVLSVGISSRPDDSTGLYHLVNCMFIVVVWYASYWQLLLVTITQVLTAMPTSRVWITNPSNISVGVAVSSVACIGFSVMASVAPSFLTLWTRSRFFVLRFQRKDSNSVVSSTKTDSIFDAFRLSSSRAPRTPCFV